jgi:hypothetical protein
MTFPWFISDFNEKVEMLDPKPGDSALSMYLVDGIRRCGYTDLDKTIDYCDMHDVIYERLVVKLIGEHAKLLTKEKVKTREFVNVSVDERLNDPKAGIECFKCRQFGHYSNECPRLNDEEKRRVEEKKRKRWEEKNGSVKRQQTIPGKTSANDLTALWKKTAKGHRANVLDHTNLNDDVETSNDPGGEEESS